jgi:hypothetical protein
MNPTRPPVAQTRPAGLGPAHARAAPPAQPPPPGTAGVEAAKAAAEAAEAERYKAERTQAVVLAAGALVLADTIRTGVALPDLATETDVITATEKLIGVRISVAFKTAEAFIAEAEKRLGGKLPL